MDVKAKSPLEADAPGPLVLAVSSAGGAWVQLKRVLPAFDHCELIIATVPLGEVDPVACARRVDLPDTRGAGWLARSHLAWQLFRLVITTRPAVVVTTGDGPGVLALRFGKWVGARTVWIESIAHLERISRLGRRVHRHADLWLTQWAHLESPEGPRCFGPVL